MAARHAGYHVITETVRGVDVERSATRVLNGVFGLKLVELLKQSLPNVGNSHFASETDFHANALNISRTKCMLILL